MNDTKEMQVKIAEISEILEGVDESQKVEMLRDYIMKNEKSVEFPLYFDTGGIKSCELYANVDKYIGLLDNYEDKIYLAQLLCDFKLAENLFKEYPFTQEEKEKFDNLAENNEDITKTLRPKILSSKYNFLNSKMDFIVADSDRFGTCTQSRILKMSERDLEIFKILYRKVEEDTKDTLAKTFELSIGTNMYSKINEELYQYIQEGNIVSDDTINKLVWLYTKKTFNTTTLTRKIAGKIKHMEDVNNLEDIIKETCDEFVLQQKDRDDKNLASKVVKEAILMTSYGITLLDTKLLVNGYNMANIEINEENKKQYLMYLVLSEIYNENNLDKLIAIYNDYTKENDVKIDYLRTSVFKGELTNIFAKEFNNAFTPIEQFSRLDDDNNVTVYDAGTDFKICMTAIGAYQDNFSDKENYSEYWNNRKIMAHTSSCSLIANNNLTTAEIKNICLGFSSFEEEMLYGGGKVDVASDKQYFKMVPIFNIPLSSTENMINSTRGQYNELVYERRDLGNGKYYKKNPDFIVFFEEFDGLKDVDTNDLEVKEILSNEKRKWQESIKAAKDFGVPIVKINRERCAKSESEKIEKDFQKYLQTHDVSLLSSIITNFENNRTGTRGHSYLTEKYFSSEKIQDMLNQVKESLQQEKDKKVKNVNKQKIIDLLKQEQKNIEECKNVVTDTIPDNCKNKFSSFVDYRAGLNIDDYLNTLESSLQLENYENER